jgi:radical SAM superfamily enzyme YgiQ (UPF0313 family)
MKVLLANMPWSKDGRQGVRAGSRWPHLKDSPESNYLPYPFFLAHTASLLEKHGFTVCLIDAICDEMSDSDFIRAVEAFCPDLFIAETSTVSLHDDLIFLLRFDKKFKIALCGPDHTMQSPDFFEKHPFVDFVFRGEYECTALDLARALKDNASLSSVSGLNYQGEAHTCFINSSRPLADINTLPWPKRAGLKMDRYIDSPGEMPFPTVQMLASRGCPFGCLFCLWPQVMYGGQTYRVRDAQDVLDEMEEMVKKYGFRSIYFDDDTFGLNQEWTHAFCDEFLKRNEAGRINVPWAMMTRPDAMNEAILDKLKKTGLWAIKYGMESGDQALVNAIGKNLDLELSKHIIRYTHSLGIKTHLTFTFGLPGETKKTIQRTIHTALDLNPFSLQFSITTPFPGTKYFTHVEEKGFLKSRNFEDYDGNTKSVIRTESLSPDDLVAARQRAYRLWNARLLRRRMKQRIKKIHCFYMRLRSRNTFFLFSYLVLCTAVYYAYLGYVKIFRHARV